MPVPMLRENLSQLPSDVVARILDALHDLKDAELHDACRQIIWSRHATVGGEWPVVAAEIGPICLVVDGSERELQSQIRAHRLRQYCRTVRGTTPSDPAHRVARMLDWSYVDADGRPRRFHGIECACGAPESRLHIGHVRCAPFEAHVWPTTIIPGVNNGHPVFVVCKYAEHAQDPLHAPNSLGDRCLCGGNLGKWNEWADVPTADKYLSVQ